MKASNIPGIVLALLLLPVAAGLFASEASAPLEKTYNDSFTEEQRFQVMRQLIDLDDSSLGPFLKNALTALVGRRIETGSVNEIKTKVDLAKLIVIELGALKAIDARTVVIQVYREAKDAFLAGESALALARMGATEYVDLLARDLKDINLRPNTADSRSQEVRASYLVRSLELYGDPKGIESVFLASFAWYSPASQVRDLARTAFATMTDDPIPFLSTIVEGDHAVPIKVRALEAGEASKAVASAKADLARKALDRALSLAGNDVMARAELSTLRIKAMQMLIAVGDKSAASVNPLSKSVTLNYSFDEVLTAYTAAGKNASSEATDYLIAQLSAYNRRQASGVVTNDSERKFIRQIIASLAEIGNAKAKSVLTDAQFANYDAQTTREARDALALLPK